VSYKQISAAIIGVVLVLQAFATKGDIVTLVLAVAMCTLLGGC